MKRYLNGHYVPVGFYFSLRPLDFRLVSVEGETLNGRPQGHIYHRIPSLLMLLVAPIFGGVFVLMFPALVVSAVVGVAGWALWRKLGAAMERSAHYLSDMHFQPAASYLKWRESRRNGSAVELGEVPEELQDLADEVTAARKRDGI